jgi:hypothetical protein
VVAVEQDRRAAVIGVDGFGGAVAEVVVDAEVPKWMFDEYTARSINGRARVMARN